MKKLTADDVKREVLEAAWFDARAALSALEDGAYLAAAGYSDDDTEAIEGAHAMLKEELKYIARQTQIRNEMTISK